MTTNEPKFRSSTDRNTSGPGATEDDTGIPPSVDPVGRYRYLVNAAPLETIERATAEMLEGLSAADGARIRDRLDQFPELRGADPEEGLRALERAVRAGVAAQVGDDLCLVLARAFVTTPTASAFLSRLGVAGRGQAPQTEPEDDPDFSDEFGFESGYAGGSGFENVEFDRWT